MGGDRTDYLAALDDRIQLRGLVGWMSTYGNDPAHVDTHSFMHFLPGLTPSWTFRIYSAAWCPNR